MHPYRQEPTPAAHDGAEEPLSTRLALPLLVLATGLVGAAPALARGEVFGPQASLAALFVLAGLRASAATLLRRAS